jgi:SAM-dependent MidA family methyltransferase
MMRSGSPPLSYTGIKIERLPVMSLAEIIIGKIRKEGPVSFHEFMEMCLYYPGSGYYQGDRDKIGKSGDFYTSPYLSSLFGDMVARQLEEMWIQTGKASFAIVEYGAGSGLLCRDVLQALQAKNIEFYDHLHYYIIEKGAGMREKGRSLLREGSANGTASCLSEKVSWVENLMELTPITGCILSNELLDNFSVHQVVMEDELMEVYVDYNEGFTELMRPAGLELKDYLDELQVSLPRGFRTEINLEAVNWIKEISHALEKGFVLTIDYGYPSSALYSDKRNSGTLVCYHRHRINYCPYDHIGEQDITAHVNFSALHRWGLRHGLQTCGYTNQSHFMRGLGLAGHIRQLEEKQGGARVSEEEKAFLLKTLLMDMGSRFKILIQQKGVHRPYISGLRFSEKLD